MEHQQNYDKKQQNKEIVINNSLITRPGAVKFRITLLPTPFGNIGVKLCMLCVMTTALSHSVSEGAIIIIPAYMFASHC